MLLSIETNDLAVCILLSKRQASNAHQLVSIIVNVCVLWFRGSRSGTPVQSDTEVELAGRVAADKSSQSWRWGELPEPPVRGGDSPAGVSPPSPGSPPSPASPAEPLSSDEERPSRRGVLSGMFRFMSPRDSDVPAEGVYLDDLDRGQVDPDLYFPKHHADRFRSGEIICKFHICGFVQDVIGSLI